jgi:activator of HSP90 ATPase
MVIGPNSSVPTRRQALAAFAAIAAASLTRAKAQQPEMAEKPSTPTNKNRTSIHYEIDFKPSPQRLYEAILDQKQFAAFSGLPATIDPTPGGAFSMFGGLIVGRNIDLVTKIRIVQAWRPTHWDPGVYSIVHFEFKPRSEETTMLFDHTGFPAGDYDSLDQGWTQHYWNPLKKFLV